VITETSAGKVMSSHPNGCSQVIFLGAHCRPSCLRSAQAIHPLGYLPNNDEPYFCFQEELCCSARVYPNRRQSRQAEGKPKTWLLEKNLSFAHRSPYRGFHELPVARRGDQGQNPPRGFCDELAVRSCVSCLTVPAWFSIT